MLVVWRTFAFKGFWALYDNIYQYVLLRSEILHM
jgi:hypothetical protein